MRFSSGKSQIIGIRVGEVALNSLNPDTPILTAKFVLLREDGTHAGLHTKGGSWGKATIEALQALIGAMEEDTLPDLFEEDTPQAVGGDTTPLPQDIPTLGRKKGVPQV